MPTKRKSAASPKESSTATIGFEAKLWLTADKLRNNMDAAEPSGARQAARQGSPKGERGDADQYFLTRFDSAEGKNGGPAKCEVRSASVEANTSQPFVIRNSSFGISLGPEYADTFRRDFHPDLRVDTATRVSE